MIRMGASLGVVVRFSVGKGIVVVSATASTLVYMKSKNGSFARASGGQSAYLRYYKNTVLRPVKPHDTLNRAVFGASIDASDGYRMA